MKYFLALLLICLPGPAFAQWGVVNAGASLPPVCHVGDAYITTSTPTLSVCNSTNVWTSIQNLVPSVPSGLITLVTSGSCPSGYTELSALSGKTVIGTTAANGDVGTTGGANTITPAGTNATSTVTPSGTVTAPTFTGSAGTVPAEVVSWPAGVPTFAGSALGTHTHTTTATGTISALTTGADSSTTGGVAKAIAQTPTFTGNSVTSSAVSAGTPAGTVAWPAGVPTNATASFTPAGTNSIPTFTGSSSTVGAQVFTGTSFDNRPAFIKVIFCQKD